jgi:alkanesulfonate monooxygenase SsuD/methylene tetrahydromethanopterin reductase-like flavin-dependent oxidoreductase (luciferase family)
MLSAGQRIAKLGEFVDLMRAHWSGEQIDQHGTYVDVTGFSGLPRPVQQPGPPIIIGGGAPKILRLAGERADIVSINFNNASGKLGSASVMGSGAEETHQKLGWIREGAGDRFDAIEIEIGAYFVAVGDAAAAQLDAMASRFGVAAEEFASHPHALFGTTEQICETLQARREQYGVSYVTVAQRNMDEFAPVVAALSGH